MENKEQIVLWYDEIFPYDRIIKTRTNNNEYLFVLFLNDKIVAIGGKSEMGDGVYNDLNVIFKSHQVFKKVLKRQLKNGGDLWRDLYDFIKDKRLLGRSELPEQPRRLLYQTHHHGEDYIIYENRWRQPRRFTLWSGTTQQQFIFHSDTLSDVTERLSRIVNRQIILIQ